MKEEKRRQFLSLIINTCYSGKEVIDRNNGIERYSSTRLYLKLKWKALVMLFGNLNSVLRCNYGQEYCDPC